MEIFFLLLFFLVGGLVILVIRFEALYRWRTCWLSSDMGEFLGIESACETCGSRKKLWKTLHPRFSGITGEITAYTVEIFCPHCKGRSDELIEIPVEAEFKYQALLNTHTM